MSKKSTSIKGFILGIVILGCIVTVVMLIKGAWFSPDEEAAAVVEEFYLY